jgi:hypothetical protein
MKIPKKSGSRVGLKNPPLSACHELSGTAKKKVNICGVFETAVGMQQTMANWQR